jgi:ABC-type xylose transport system permease subunit
LERLSFTINVLASIGLFFVIKGLSRKIFLWCKQKIPDLLIQLGLHALFIITIYHIDHGVGALIGIVHGIMSIIMYAHWRDDPYGKNTEKGDFLFKHIRH